MKLCWCNLCTENSLCKHTHKKDVVTLEDPVEGEIAKHVQLTRTDNSSLRCMSPYLHR